MPMEADWEVEIGPGSPIIDALWPGFVDLRRFPGAIGDLEEARRCSALAEALFRLNSEDVSGFWTSKCDVWRLDAGMGQCDPDEIYAVLQNSVSPDPLNRHRMIWGA